LLLVLIDETKTSRPGHRLGRDAMRELPLVTAVNQLC